MRRRHVQYMIEISPTSQDQGLFWVYNFKKFMKIHEISLNEDDTLVTSFSSEIYVKTLKKAQKILNSLFIEYKGFKITFVKRIFDRTKKWPRGKERVYIYEPVV